MVLTVPSSSVGPLDVYILRPSGLSLLWRMLTSSFSCLRCKHMKCRWWLLFLPFIGLWFWSILWPPFDSLVCSTCNFSVCASYLYSTPQHKIAAGMLVGHLKVILAEPTCSFSPSGKVNDEINISFFIFFFFNTNQMTWKQCLARPPLSLSVCKKTSEVFLQSFI